jgi:NADH-quinone oxidoreductase subunit L
MTSLLAWSIPALPLAGAILNGLFGFTWLRRSSHLVAVGASGLAFASAFTLFLRLSAGAPPLTLTLYEWLFGGGLHVHVGLLIDPLTAIMLMVITGVGSLIHLYAVGYMHDDPGFPRFFTYLNLFLFSMLVLVMADNYLLFFVGWEGVGLCSYLLIAFWYEKRSAAMAGTKAFVVNRIGDAGFLLGVFLIYATFGSLDYATVFSRASGIGTATATAITLLLLVGAVGKSAQLPLYTWLPDAMEGPTPVSALIHAATMVTAGVYMVVRNHALYAMAPLSMETVAVIGAVTAIFAASIGLVQYDIKRVLAYSTVSQLGYMFMAAGLGAYAAAVFHLMTHAFFKALLFLAAGSVIHALGGEQDIRKMGGLWSRIPVTAWTFLIGTIAIAGIPPLAGFWSKDEILGAALAGGHPLIWLLGLIAACMTAFYMFRLFFLTFRGESRLTHEAEHHLHESPLVMTGPLMVLALLSTVGGALPGYPSEEGWIHTFLAPVVSAGGGAHAEEAAVGGTAVFGVAASIVVALLGTAIAWLVYLGRPSLAETGLARFKALHRLLLNKYWVDELYDVLVVNPVKAFGRAWDRFDSGVIDAVVNGVGRTTGRGAALSTWFETYVIYGSLNLTGYANHLMARVLRLFQTGLVHHYAMMFLIGLFLLANLVCLFWLTVHPASIDDSLVVWHWLSGLGHGGGS